MKILLSNDDGIYAPGLRALADIASDLGEVWIVAPDREQSSVGHAISLSDPIRVAPYPFPAFTSPMLSAGLPLIASNSR